MTSNHTKHDPLYQAQSRGLLYSVVGHLAIFVMFFVGDFLGAPDFGPETVYSVTIEGGQSLGGLSQLENKKNKEKPAPPKPEPNKAKAEKAEVAKKEVEEVKQKVEEKKEEAEVSSKKESEKKPEEKKEKSEVKSTPKPQPTVDPKKQKQKEQAELDKEYQKAMQRYLGESSDAGAQGFGAARLGGNGMGGGEIRPPEFFMYRDLIKKTVKRNWSWFDTSTSLRANVTFYISPEGEISEVSIAKSSGNSLFDDSLERALLKSSPLPPPPDNVYQWFKYIRMEFDPQE
jgi:colicin import membrane protein